MQTKYKGMSSCELATKYANSDYNNINSQSIATANNNNYYGIMEMAGFLRKTLKQFYVDVQRASVSSDPKAKAWLTLMMSR